MFDLLFINKLGRCKLVCHFVWLVPIVVNLFVKLNFPKIRLVEKFLNS